jgi:hypothetical protein
MPENIERMRLSVLSDTPVSMPVTTSVARKA